MYIPPQFVEKDLSILQSTIKELRFGSLITVNGQSILASHIPMLIDDKVGTYGVLEGHIARANPQGAGITKSIHALAIFTGPNAYISPSWYATTREHGKAVPTWNYIAVHAFGALEIIEDKKWLQNHVEKLTDQNEHGRQSAWSISDAPENYIESQLGGILGWRMPIERIEGAWKMIQHHTEGNRRGTIEALSNSDKAGDIAVSEVMKNLEIKRKSNQ